MSALLAAAADANALPYWFTDLGTLGGGQSSALDINNAGQVVGYSTTNEGAHHATLWMGGKMSDLGTLGGTDSFAYGINNSGQIVGYSNTGAGTSRATLWSRHGKLTELSTLGGANSFAYGINDAGLVVGESSIDGNSASHAAAWKGSKVIDLGTLAGAGSSRAFGVSNSGTVVGSSVVSQQVFGSRATMWSGRAPSELSGLGGESVATAINNSGKTVGFGYLANNTNSRAIVWHGSEQTTLGDFAGGSSFALDINDRGQVVGHSFTVDSQIGQHAALWNGTAPTDLNTLVDESVLDAGWLLEDATGINDRGWITGNARNRFTGESHAYLLSTRDRASSPPLPSGESISPSPVPEAETWAMLIAGLGLMGLAARRRR